MINSVAGGEEELQCPFLEINFLKVNLRIFLR